MGYSVAKVAESKLEPIQKKLWDAADKLRKNIDAAEYKHVVLGLIFLKYISDAFEEVYGILLQAAHSTVRNTNDPILIN